MNAASLAIETAGLRKEYGAKVAVADLSLAVARGEIFGFLGPNGAGKTTAVKMLLGLAAPTAGTVRLLGSPVGDHRVRARVGFLPEHFRFHDWLTGREFLALHADLHRMPRATAGRRAAELLDLVGLATHAGKQLRHYSKGMLQRIGLAQALLNEPELVLLDEPTSGLDPGGRILVRDILRDLRRRGTTVFLNSHLLGEVEAVCDRVAFVRRGEVVKSGTLASLADGRLHVAVRARGLTPAVIAGLALLAGDVAADGDALTFTVASEEALPAIHRHLVGAGVEVFAFAPERPSLEELFVAIVGARGHGEEL